MGFCHSFLVLLPGLEVSFFISDRQSLERVRGDRLQVSRRLSPWGTILDAKTLCSRKCPHPAFPDVMARAPILFTCWGGARLLCLLVSGHSANQRHFHGLPTATFFTHLRLLSVISLFKIGPKPRAEVLPGALSTRKLMEGNVC